MDNAAKLAALRVAISPDTETEEVLSSLLTQAEALVLNRLYPFGYADDTAVPRRYEQIQIQIAVELYTKRGAEGQISHVENGTARMFASDSAMLKQIVPHVGSVTKDA